LPRFTPLEKRLDVLTDMFQRTVAPGSEFWLLLCRDFHEDPDRELQTWLQGQSTAWDYVAAFPHAVLIKGVRRVG
jgi:hypothetical protein